MGWVNLQFLLFDLDPETPVPLEDGKENGGEKMHSAWMIIMICSLIVTEMLNFLWIDIQIMNVSCKLLQEYFWK